MEWLPVPQLLILPVVLYTLYGISLVVYRLFLHPLAHIPGPKLAAATYWYDFYYDCVAGPIPGQGIFNVERLHDVYGPVVRVNPDEVAVRDPYWYDTLYNSGRRDKWMRNQSANGSPGSITSAATHAHHKARRAPMTPFFSKRSITSLEEVIHSKLELLCRGVERFMDKGKVLELGTAFTALTLDVITDYALGQDWKTLEDEEFSPEWKRAMSGMFDPVPFTKQFPALFRFILMLPESWQASIDPGLGVMAFARKAITKCVDRIQAEREHGQLKTSLDSDGRAQHRTVIAAVLDSSLPAEEKVTARIADEAFVLVVAGGETTAMTLTYLFYHLFANPSWLARVRAELDGLMPDPASPLASWSELERLPALAGAIKETLRVGGLATNRTQLMPATEPLTYHAQGSNKTWVFPPGTPISMSTLSIHNDPAIFPEPKTFNPGRWIDGHKSRSKEGDQFYSPFSKGTRSCLGMNLAYAEIYLAAAVLLRRYDFELYDVVKERDVDVARDAFVGKPGKDARPIRAKIIGRRK